MQKEIPSARMKLQTVSFGAQLVQAPQQNRYAHSLDCLSLYTIFHGPVLFIGRGWVKESSSASFRLFRIKGKDGTPSASVIFCDISFFSDMLNSMFASSSPSASSELLGMIQKGLRKGVPFVFVS